MGQSLSSPFCKMGIFLCVKFPIHTASIWEGSQQASLGESLLNETQAPHPFPQAGFPAGSPGMDGVL